MPRGALRLNVIELLVLIELQSQKTQNAPRGIKTVINHVPIIVVQCDSQKTQNAPRGIKTDAWSPIVQTR